MLPALSSAWTEILGTPVWHVEWVNSNGDKEAVDTDGGTDITVLQEWPTPVFAYPYWPAHNIRQGVMRCAGAIFPYDAKDTSINLSWLGGVEAEVYRNLAGMGNDKRQPTYFDWPRFRSLLESTDIPEAVRNDPWLADWETICTKTADSGFDRRRIKVMERQDVSLSLPSAGPWIGTSPFAEVLTGAELHIPVSSCVDTYFSSAGTLHINEDAWFYTPNEM
ncbi:hypothetical protein AGMMS49928_29950 [Spirochaetia bacterium]|nr:hypothetical protein AGMMS49928_29950 [Spirochaetia bacterium]